MISDTNREALTYDDVLLQPQFSEIRSRSDIDIGSDLGNGLELSLPIFSSPMDTITGGHMASSMYKFGGAGIIHRYNTIEEQVLEVVSAYERSVNSTSPILGAAVGVTGDYLERATALLSAGVDFLCVDVAHGHHIMMKEALESLRNLTSDFHIMAGNVATLQGVNDLADWGADSVRCNIGGGSICSTRIQTGHGLPGLQTIFECVKTDRDVAIIADGGIRNSGDIVKALAAGADAVMCGSLLSGTTESPGEVFEGRDGFKYKSYRGMASKEAQMKWRGKYSSFEGVSTQVPFRGTVVKILEDLERGIRSGFSYTGAHNLKELQTKASFIRQTSAGLGESRTHINTRKW
jgi:IMP dehydrogenase